MDLLIKYFKFAISLKTTNALINNSIDDFPDLDFRLFRFSASNWVKLAIVLGLSFGSDREHRADKNQASENRFISHQVANSLNIFRGTIYGYR